MRKFGNKEKTKDYISKKCEISNLSSFLTITIPKAVERRERIVEKRKIEICGMDEMLFEGNIGRYKLYLSE